MTIELESKVEIYDDFHPLHEKYRGKIGTLKKIKKLRGRGGYGLIYTIEFDEVSKTIVSSMFVREVTNSIRFIKE